MWFSLDEFSLDEFSLDDLPAPNYITTAGFMQLKQAAPVLSQ